MARKAQAWGFDLTIAAVIFFFGIITIYMYSLNYPKETEKTINSLEYEGNNIASDLLSEGYPLNWNLDNVAKIGLTIENKINETKLEQFYYLSTENYDKTRALLKTKYNFFVNFSEPIEINSNIINGIGKKPLSSKNLIKITRLTVYKNKPASMDVWVWE